MAADPHASRRAPVREPSARSPGSPGGDPWLKGVGQISLPVAAFLVVYVAALVALLIQGFWTTDSFTGKLVHDWSLDNFRALRERAVSPDRRCGRSRSPRR